MRKIILLLVLCIGFYGAKAAPAITIVNNTACDITFTVFAYDPILCTITSSGTPTNLPAGKSTTVGGYGVEFYFTSCPPPAPVIYTAFGTSCFPPTVPMPNCGPCVGSTVTWNSAHMVTIN
ncbi:MAG TPA: hypothetical protein VN726_21255 [Hanamia sp.]|nr:hypothetical protein [Hanamia sp.]